MHCIDLRSDIVSTPTPSMRLAMTEAAMQRPGFGMREDVAQQELEALSAKLLGMEDALFFPTCTMANQVALMLRCPPGFYVLADKTTHLCGTEGSSTAGIAGVPIIGLEGVRGHLTPEQVTSTLGRSRQETQMPVGLVWLENTHNFAGGTVMPVDDFQGVIVAAKSHKVPVHLDGSRLWNAVAFLGVSPEEVVQGADSVAFSLNKVLAAPLGAVLVGTRSFIANAVRVRNMLGGGMRPAGILAAAGLVALKEERARVADDHRRARKLSDALANLNWLKIDRERVQTNIVVAEICGFPGKVEDLILDLKQKGILVNLHGTQGIRMVLHGDVDDASIPVVVDAFRAVSKSRPTS